MMSKEKFDEITELSDDIYNSFQHIAHSDSRNIAESLYNDGWRKQSEAEWISVDERLPDQYEDVLGFCHYVYESGGVCDLILTMKLTTDGKFVPFNCSPLKEGIVTHWMPLPEPPGMKGGE